MADIGDVDPGFVAPQPRYSVQELKEGAIQYADHYGVPRDMFLGYFGAESNWNPLAKNPKSSATGLGQIIDATGERLGLKITGGPDDERFDPGKNMDAIGREMSRLYEVHGGDWKKVLLSIGEPHEGYYNQVKNRAAQEMGMAPGERLPEFRERQDSILERVKDYLGYQDLPAFMPIFNRDSQEWERKTLYEARKLYHGWEEPTEVEKTLFHWLNPLTLGMMGEVEEDIRGRPMPAPETALGTVLGAAGEFAGLLAFPYPLARGIIGGRLTPTRSGLRGVAQMMHESGSTLALATGLTSIFPTLMGNEDLTEAGYNFIKGTASSYMVGAMFPIFGANTGKIPSTALRTAAGLAAMDFLRTRFHEAPDKGWFTIDDVYRGVMDGSIDKRVLAQKTFDYLVDLYFLGKTPTLGRSMAGLKAEELKRNAAIEQALKVSPQEAEDAIMEIAGSGVLVKPPEKGAEAVQEAAAAALGQEIMVPPEKAPGEVEARPGEAEPQAGKPGPLGEGQVIPEAGQIEQAAVVQPRNLGLGRQPKYNLDKAVERLDRATIIKAFGGFNPKARIIKEDFAPEEQRLLRLYSRKGAQGPDELLEELKGAYPYLFGKYEDDAQFLRALVNGDFHKTLDIDKIAKEEADYYEAIDRQAEAEGIDPEALARTVEADKRAIIAERNAATGEKSAGQDLTTAWDEAEATYNLKKQQAPPPVTPEQLRRIYPDITPEQAEILAQDPKLREQFAQGNWQAVAREKALGQVSDVGAQRELAGVAAGLFAEPAKEPWKEPWELTAEEYLSRHRALSMGEAEGVRPKTDEQILKLREQDVAAAMKAGKPVLLEVAEEFPALMKKYGEKLMYGGGPDTVEMAKEFQGLGAKFIDWFDARLEKNLPPELKDPDASKVVGSLLLKIQQFEDISRTYPEAGPFFEAARAGLVLKMRHAQEFYTLAAPYLTQLNPEERARVDKVLVDRDILNQPGAGREPEIGFRLKDDIEVWRSYLLNPREEVKERGVAWYMARGLSPKEAEGAFGVRMAMDYAKTLHLDWHTRVFQEWLAAHGFDPGKIKDIIDLTLNTQMNVEELAKAYFGDQPGKNILGNLGRFRETMDYWLKETNEYIPRSRYGEFFIRVYAKDTALVGKAKDFLRVIEERFPGGLEAAQNPEAWTNQAGKFEVPGEIRQHYMMMKKALTEPGKKTPWGHRLVEEALKSSRTEEVHAEAAETRAQYHEKMARLREEFPEGEYVIKESLEKNLPMEIFAETHIPRVWRIVSEAGRSGKMPLEAKEAMMEAWQDFLAAKGFGAHYIKRQKIPGYETDLMRPVTDYLAGLSGYIGKMEKIRGFSEAYQNIPKEMPNLFREMNNYANYILSNPYEFQGLRKAIYNWTLGGNFSFYFINALQNVNVGWAVLGQVSKSPLKELGAAYKDWSKYLFTGEGLRPGEEAILARARYEPELSPSGAEELTGRAYNPLYRWMHQDPTSVTSKGIDVFKEFWYGSGVEKMNRETCFLAAYRATGDYERSIELTRDAHFLYGRETRPAMFRGAGAIPGVFMTYSVNYFTLLKNFSKAAAGVSPEVYGSREQGALGLARMTAGAMVTGGTAAAVGTAVWSGIKAAWRRVFGSDLEEDGKRWLEEDLGVSEGLAQFGARALFRGLPAAALGTDISARIAPNLPFMNLPPGDFGYADLVAGLLGAGSIPLQRAFQVGAALAEGQKWRALEYAAPTSVQNLLMAGRLGTEGATTLSGRPIFTKEGEPLVLDLPETVAKAFGFQPTRLAEHWAREAHARALERQRKSNVHDIAGDLARSIRDQDEAGFNAAIEDWVGYNNKMLERGRLADIISPESVEAAVHRRFQPRYPDVSEKKMMLREIRP